MSGVGSKAPGDKGRVTRPLWDFCRAPAEADTVKVVVPWGAGVNENDPDMMVGDRDAESVTVVKVMLAVVEDSVRRRENWNGALIGLPLFVVPVWSECVKMCLDGAEVESGACRVACFCAPFGVPWARRREGRFEIMSRRIVSAST